MDISCFPNSDYTRLMFSPNMKLLFFNNPRKLEDCCLHAVRQQFSRNVQSLVKEKDISLPCALADKLMPYLVTQLETAPKKLKLELFRSSVMPLQHIKIVNSTIPCSSLKFLLMHRLVSLQLCNIGSLNICGLIHYCLSEETRHSLRYLNLSGTFVPSQAKELEMESSDTDAVSPGIANTDSAQALGACRWLTALDVSKSLLSDTGLNTFVVELPHIRYLNISETLVHDISSLLNMVHLSALAMYNLSFRNEMETVKILERLDGLTFLDISAQPDGDNSLGSMVVRNQHCLPNLILFDVSGVQANFEVNIMTKFMAAHPSIQFLGLLMTNASCFDQFLTPSADSALSVAGDASKSQILISLNTYIQREGFCSKTFFHLFTRLSSQEFDCNYAERNFCIQQIVTGMKEHVSSLNVQMAATACLHSFCRQANTDEDKPIHPKLLKDSVSSCLQCLQTHKDSLQLHKNVWLTICIDYILSSEKIDYFKCCELAFHSMLQFSDISITRLCVAIVSIVAAKIPTAQSVKLGANPEYMKHLLKLIRDRIPSNGNEDLVVLRYAISALWNLSDESPQTCDCFLEHNGLLHCMSALQNNVAEVEHLKARLFDGAFLELLLGVLDQNKLEDSYFACGILSHLCASFQGTFTSPSKDDCLKAITKSVQNWTTPNSEMVAYRSFKPFYPLLKRIDLPEVQLWALWAIRHVCSKNKERYRQMLLESGGSDMVYFLAKASACRKDVQDIACDIVNLLEGLE